MAKRLFKQPAHTGSDDAGCLSGFMGIFDFHIGHYSQKLLSDKKRGSSRGLATGYLRKKLDFPSNLGKKHEDDDDGDESREKGFDSGILSVKTLMEEEMSKTHITKIQNNELEQSHSESRFGIHLKEKYNKKSKKKGNVVPDYHVNDLRYDDQTEISSMTNELAAFMVQFTCDSQSRHKVQVDSEINLCRLLESNVHRKKIHIDETDSQLSEKYFALQKALYDVAKVFLSQQLVDSNELVNNAAVQSKEFMDALGILSSNKELLMNHMQNPSLLLLKHVQDIQDALGSEILGEESNTSVKLEDSISNDLFKKQSHHKFSSKKDKPKGSDSSRDMSKIVVLKPSPSVIQNNLATQASSSSPLSHHSLKHEEGERTKSYFSLKGIKRKLRNAMGESRKGQHPISMDGLLDRIPYGSKDSGDSQKSFALASKNSCNTEQNSPPAVSKKIEKPKLKIENPQTLLDDEAKKHLTEIVVARKDSLPTVLKSSGRVVSLPEYNSLSPRFSPVNEEELVLSPQKIIFSPSLQLNRESPMNHLGPLSQTIDQDAKTHVTKSNQERIAENLKAKGSIEIVESSDITSLETHDNLAALPESIGSKPDFLCEGCNEQGSSALLELETSNGKPQLVIPCLSISPRSLHGEKLENPDDVLEKPERPSPVSVLEPFLLEDIISPVSTTADHVDLPLQRQQMDFQDNDDLVIVLNSSDVEDKPITWFDEREVVYAFVRTLLRASGMSCYRILERWNSSNQLLDPSLFEEVGIIHSLLPDDSKLLFDCMNEVLVDTQETLFGSTPWVSLIKPSSPVILRGEELIEEVCQSVYGHLQLSQFTLDHVVRKDIEGGSWMDNRVEIEDIVIEMADEILEEMVKDTMCKYFSSCIAVLTCNVLTHCWT